MRFHTVDEYIASQPLETQCVLLCVRNAILGAIPGVEERIAYDMPTYTLRGRVVLHFAAWKRHYSLYAASASIVKTFADELRSYKIEKGTIRFPLGEPFPKALIERIAAFRAQEIDSRDES